MSSYQAVEHGGGRVARWLKANRFKIALLIGSAETLAILFTDATWWSALVLAAIIFALHLWVGRRAKSETVRQLSWAAAGSQVLPVLVPAVVSLVAIVAIVMVVVLAIVIAVMLFLDRK